MLTKQIEGSTEKCGCYWGQSAYGPLRLELLSSSGDEEAEARSQPPNPCFDFGVSTSFSNPEKSIVRRTFLLSHSRYPHVPPRKVTQLQYLAWSDFDVPNDPGGLLKFMNEVDTLRAEPEQIGSSSDAILLHCSAGIGRTGGYIIIDAILDSIRNELTNRRSKPTVDDFVDINMNTEDALITNQHEESSAGEPRQASRTHKSSGGTNCSGQSSIEFRDRSTSPASSVLGNVSDSSMSSSLLPSVLNANGDSRGCPMTASPPPMHTSKDNFDAEQAKLIGALNKLKHSSPGHTSSNSNSTTTLPSGSNFSWVNEGKSMTTTSSPLSVESSRPASPNKVKILPQTHAVFDFDYTLPRQLNTKLGPQLLSSLQDPVQSVLEDMREQRMSLCQSLRQYVFVHRAIIEGALSIVDEHEHRRQRRDRAMSIVDLESSCTGKRLATPTELPMVDPSGAIKLVKRPSYKRRDRSDTTVLSTFGAQTR